MAKILPFIVEDSSQLPVIGRQLFDVITAGMYDNPLMIYREYVQNSVDAIDLAVASGVLTHHEARVDIQIDRSSRSIVVEDNGLGLINDSAHKILVSLGCSPKESTGQRGFRGIGRLGGLAYCERLVFETRSKANEDVAVVSWDKGRFEALSAENRLIGLEETLLAVSRCDFRTPTEQDPEHFFRVKMEKVTDFHSDDLMSLKKVNAYLAQVGPVPYDHKNFSFAVEIEAMLRQLGDYRCYSVFLNNLLIVRPYIDKFTLSSQRSDAIEKVIPFQFIGMNGEPIAIGWYAQMGFFASVPASTNMRGLRVRLGNIEVGDQNFLTHYYSESRFAAWHIGEIHIVDRRLKPNARRDAFEHTEDLERFFEQAQQLCRVLSSLCRKASSRRCSRDRAVRALTALEKLCGHQVAFIDKTHFRKTIEKAEKMLLSAESAIRQLGADESLIQRLEFVRVQIRRKIEAPTFLRDLYDGRSVKNDEKGEKAAKTLAHVSHIIMTEFSRCESPNDLLNAILEQYLVSEKKGAVTVATL